MPQAGESGSPAMASAEHAREVRVNSDERRRQCASEGGGGLERNQLTVSINVCRAERGS